MLCVLGAAPGAFAAETHPRFWESYGQNGAIPEATIEYFIDQNSGTRDAVKATVISQIACQELMKQQKMVCKPQLSDEDYRRFTTLVVQLNNLDIDERGYVSYTEVINASARHGGLLNLNDKMLLQNFPDLYVRASETTESVSSESSAGGDQKGSQPKDSSHSTPGLDEILLTQENLAKLDGRVDELFGIGITKESWEQAQAGIQDNSAANKRQDAEINRLTRRVSDLEADQKQQGEQLTQVEQKADQASSAAGTAQQTADDALEATNGLEGMIADVPNQVAKKLNTDSCSVYADQADKRKECNGLTWTLQDFGSRLSMTAMLTWFALGLVVIFIVISVIRLKRSSRGSNRSNNSA